MPRRRPVRTYDIDQEHVADVYAPRNPVERLIGGEVKVRKRVDVSDYERERNGRPEHVGAHTREQEMRARTAPPSMHALHRTPESVQLHMDYVVEIHSPFSTMSDLVVFRDKQRAMDYIAKAVGTQRFQDEEATANEIWESEDGYTYTVNPATPMED